MAKQPPGPPEGPSASAAAPAKAPDADTASREESDSGEPAKGHTRTDRIELHNVNSGAPAGKWQQIRGNIKDVVLPVAALAVTIITWYFGYQVDRHSKRDAQAESRNKLIDGLTTGTLREQQLAVLALARQRQEALPDLFLALGTTDNPTLETNVCQTLKVIAGAGGRSTRGKVLDGLTKLIEKGERVGFRGAATCVAGKTLLGDKEIRGLLKAIETQLGPDGARCRHEAGGGEFPDDAAVKSAVIAESTFPTVTGNAPGFLAGVIRNCPKADFPEAIGTAIPYLLGVYKAAYKQDCNRKLTDTLAALRAVSVDVRQQIDRDIANPVCQ